MTDDSRDTPAEPQAPSYQLNFDPAAKKLVGSIYAKPASFVSIEHLKPKIKALHCEHLYFPPDSLEQFLQKLKKGLVGNYTLAEVRDASIQVTIATDKLTARAQTTQAYGGAPLSLEAIKLAIKAAHIHGRCIDKAQIKMLLEAKKPVDITIAKAVMPEHGKDAQFIPLVKSAIAITKDADSETAIDQHEIFDFVVVEPGHPLMKRQPATSGTEGIDVTGRPIRAKAGKDKAFAKPLNGVEFSPSDPNLLQAAIKGHPVISADGVRVDPIMTVKAVDIHSGNIRFDGSLYVQQDINSGYTVEVTGDIIVKGSIFESILIAGGNIIAGGGVHTKIEKDDLTCRLSAKGDIRAKFFYQSHVCSNGDVHAREYIMQSHVQAKGSIFAGQEGGKGAIIGGVSEAGREVHARVLGNDAYVPTKIIVGSSAYKNPEVAQLKTKIKRRLDEQQQLNDILNSLEQQTSPTTIGTVTLDKKRKVEETLALIQQQISHLESQLVNHPEYMQNTGPLQVCVDNCAYLNVHVLIDGVGWKCTEIKRRFKVNVVQYALQFAPLT